MGRRGSGRSDGAITVWGRRGVTRVVPHRGGFPTGVYRLWGTTRFTAAPVGVLVGPAGLTGWGPYPGGATPGDYLAREWGPLPVRPGWTTLLRWVPVGTSLAGVYWAGRAPGTSVKVLRHRGGFTEVRLPSRRGVWVPAGTPVMFGRTPHGGHYLHRWTTAGDTWSAGGRPRIRGVATNPVDHPHGGGQGKTSGGRPGTTPWGRLTKGKKTRSPR